MASLYPDRAGNVWSIFDGQNSGTTSEIYLRMLPSSARETKIKEWTQALRISEDDKRPSIYPNIVAEDASRVTAVWMDYRHKSAEVYAKHFGNGGWSPDLLISKEAGATARKASEKMTPNQILWASPEGVQSTYPHIARAGDGSVWAVWQESNRDDRESHIVVRRLSWKGGVKPQQ